MAMCRWRCTASACWRWRSSSRSRTAPTSDVATKFVERFALIAGAARDRGLWDDAGGFFYDVLSASDGRRVPRRVRAVVGLVPLCATTTLSATTLQAVPGFAERFRWFVDNIPHAAAVVGETRTGDGVEARLRSMVGSEQLPRILAPMLAADEFLSHRGRAGGVAPTGWTGLVAELILHRPSLLHSDAGSLGMEGQPDGLVAAVRPSGVQLQRPTWSGPRRRSRCSWQAIPPPCRPVWWAPTRLMTSP
jgi:hypothetical protein